MKMFAYELQNALWHKPNSNSLYGNSGSYAQPGGLLNGLAPNPVNPQLLGDGLMGNNNGANGSNAGA